MAETFETTTPALRGPWDHAAVDAYLRETVIPVRLAAQMADGFPVVVSLWFDWDGTSMWCAMHDSARLLRHLRRDPKVAVEIAGDLPPYRGVRGQALAELADDVDGYEILRRLLTRYLGGTDGPLAKWLLGRPGELAVRLTPVRWYSWDYSSRM